MMRWISERERSGNLLIMPLMKNSSPPLDRRDHGKGQLIWDRSTGAQSQSFLIGILAMEALLALVRVFSTYKLGKFVPAFWGGDHCPAMTGARERA